MILPRRRCPHRPLRPWAWHFGLRSLGSLLEAVGAWRRLPVHYPLRMPQLSRDTPGERTIGRWLDRDRRPSPSQADLRPAAHHPYH